MTWNTYMEWPSPSSLKETISRSLNIMAPNDAQFARLWRIRAEIHPLQVCPVHGVHPLNLLVEVCLLSKTLYCVSAWKSTNTFCVSFITTRIRHAQVHNRHGHRYHHPVWPWWQCHGTKHGALRPQKPLRCIRDRKSWGARNVYI